jgi:SM-20-related protein
MIRPDAENTTQEFPATDWRAAIEALATQGYAIVPMALAAGDWRALQAEADVLLRAQAFTPARIGRAQKSQRTESIRSDGMCWLQPEMAVGGVYLRWMATLQQALNRELFLGLVEFEAHYAHYPVAAFYKKHVDRHKDSNARLISAVMYLNQDWRPEQGGEFVMHENGLEAGAELFSVLPCGGTLVLFMSADMPHEVLPALRERWSIAGWFRQSL